MLIQPDKTGTLLVDVGLQNLQGQLASVCVGKIDTGAIYTVIPWKSKKALGIRARGVVSVRGFDPKVPARRCPLYYVSVRATTLSTIRLKVIAIPRRAQILLGRDFLKHHVLVYDGLNDWAALEDSHATGKALRIAMATAK